MTAPAAANSPMTIRRRAVLPICILQVPLVSELLVSDADSYSYRGKACRSKAGRCSSGNLRRKATAQARGAGGGALDGAPHGVLRTYDGQAPAGPGQGGVQEISREQRRVRPGQDEGHAVEFRALTLVDGGGED